MNLKITHINRVTGEEVIRRANIEQDNVADKRKRLTDHFGFMLCHNRLTDIGATKNK